MKNKYIQHSWLAFFILMLSMQILDAQDKKQPYSILQNPLLAEESSPKWMNFKKNTSLDGRTIFQQYKSAYGLGLDDEMRLIKTKEDKLGFTHYRYQQYYKGFKIDGAEVLVHDFQGKSKTANGLMVQGLNMDSNPNLSPEDAIQLAMMEVDAEVYMWEDEYSEMELKEIKKDTNASYYPEPELLWVAKSNESLNYASSYLLAYKMDVHSLKPMDGKSIYIDARSGEVLRTISLIHSCTHVPATTTWYGEKIISTKRIENSNNYRLVDDCHPAVIHTTYNIGPNDPSPAVSNRSDYIAASNTWEFEHSSGVTSHWGARKAMDYFFLLHDRKSWDDNWADLHIVNMPGVGRSFHRGDGLLTIGLGIIEDGVDRGPFDDINPVDIMGHEFTHAVIRASSNLQYKGESGALNESFADIFGTMVEHAVEGAESFDWFIGEDILRGRSRYMKEPKELGDPDTYKGEFWKDTEDLEDDFGGVHTNSGVQNYWFYLLAMGGSGYSDSSCVYPSDSSHFYNIEGIGIPKARDIAYRTLTVYLNPNSQFIDARIASITAARDLYGSCSYEVEQVVKAWNAVGVVGDAPYERVCGNIKADNSNKLFEAEEGLVAGGENCQTTIKSSSFHVVFKATDYIRLQPGFHSKAGSRFKAYIRECTSGQARMAKPNVLNEEKPINSFATAPAPSLEKKNGSAFNANSFSVYPNPFSHSTTIDFQLDQEAQVSLSIRNTLGQVVAQPVVNTHRYAGIHREEFDAKNLPNGMYLCVLQVGEEQFVKKLILSK